jgi:MoaA/NifB/PqqE/SkfB family radical SAM enzyme
VSRESLAATARMGLAIGMSLASYWANASARPFSASFAVTNRCNLRCSYCNTPFLDPRDLPLERVELLLRRLHALGVRRLGLLGGEPLMRRDIGEIVSLGRRLGFYVSISTRT